MTSLSLSASSYSQLIDHLSGRTVEQVAFMFTDPPGDGGPLRVCELYPVPRDGFDFQSHRHVALADEIRSRVIKRAHDLQGCLVEVHSHVGGRAQFSASDVFGFEEWVPHVRWRLHRRPYIALVFCGRTFDALVWDGEDELPQALAALEVDGRQPMEPTGMTYRRLTVGRS